MTGTSSTTSSTSPNPTKSNTQKRQRLPVNPRRNKVPVDKQKRVATACNNCNVRRFKCSGDCPCRQCSRGSRQCVYPESVEKITVNKNEWEYLQRRCAELESQNGCEVAHEQHLLSPVTAHSIPLASTPIRYACEQTDNRTRTARNQRRADSSKTRTARHAT